MDKKQTFIIFGVLTILLLLALIFKVSREKKIVVVDNNEPVINTVEPTPVTNSTVSPVDKYKTEVPKNVIIPTMNDKTLTIEQKKEIVVPTLVTPAAPGSASSLRNFEIRAENKLFTPSKIIGKTGDSILISFSAIDQDYSISFPSYNMKGIVKKGATKIMAFQAGEVGSFKFFCDTCGENTTASGTIIIAN